MEASRGELYLTIRVADEGIGIDEGEEARVFQRFYRGRRTASYEGLGVGLYLAREITPGTEALWRYSAGTPAWR